MYRHTKSITSSHTYIQNDFHYSLPGHYVSILLITSKLLNPGAFFVAVTGRRWSQVSWRCLGPGLDYLLNSNSNSKITNTLLYIIHTYITLFFRSFDTTITLYLPCRCDVTIISYQVSLRTKFELPRHQLCCTSAKNRKEKHFNL